MKPKISTTKDGRIVIAACECAGIGKIPKASIDLKPYAGQFVRIWLEKDGAYALDSESAYWQVAELQVPELTPSPDGGEPTLDLSGVEITAWPLPE